MSERLRPYDRRSFFEWHSFDARARRLGAIVISTAAVAGCLLVVPGSAQADPPLTVADAKAQIEQLQVDAEALDQNYAGVQEQIKTGQAALAEKKADAKAQSQKLAKLKTQVGQVALAKFQNRDLDTAAQLFFTEDTQGFLNQISTVEKVNENQNTVLQSFQQEQAELADLENSTKSQLAELEAKEKDLKALRTSSEQKMNEAKTVLSRLSTNDQQTLAKDNQQADAQAQTEGAAAAKADPAAAAPASDSRGAKAVAFAKAQIGKPYRYGSAGPGAYDCSGLTGASWRAAGVSLSRTSQSQYHDGRSISRSDLQPGDLIFYYGGISHVAIYAGNGMIVHAPHPGSSVRYAKVGSMPIAGVRRPG